MLVSLPECVCVLIKDQMAHLRSHRLLEPNVLATHLYPGNHMLVTGVLPVDFG